MKKLEKTLAILKKRGIINEHLKNGARYRGVEQLVARRAHNPKVEGSSPFPATMVPWCSWLTRLPVTQKIAGSSPVGTAIFFGFIAQSVEQGTENPCVAGSIPAGATS